MLMMIQQFLIEPLYSASISEGNCTINGRRLVHLSVKDIGVIRPKSNKDVSSVNFIGTTHVNKVKPGSKLQGHETTQTEASG
ncbi:unnamed protein product [Caretta caretta]